MVRFRIRTNWTNSVSRTHEFELDDLADAATRDRLKWAFSDPERLRPGETRQSLTERVAASFASVAQALRERGHDPQAVAHFVNRLVFCMFADDVGLLPDHMFTRMLRHALPAPARFGERLRSVQGCADRSAHAPRRRARAPSDYIAAADVATVRDFGHREQASAARRMRRW